MTTRQVTTVRQTDTNRSDLTAQLLSSMVGWWDGLTYSGSGNWLNKGTVGSAGDLILGASTAAPTFSTDHFTFDGVNDTMATSGNVTSFDMPDKGTVFTVGAVISYPSSVNTNLGLLAGKAVDTTHAGWSSASNGTLLSWVFSSRDVSNHTSAAVSNTVAQGVKTLFAFGATTTQVFAKTNNSSNTGPELRTASSSNASALKVGGGLSGDLNAHIDLYSLFIHQGSLSAQDITYIGEYYGISI